MTNMTVDADKIKQITDELSDVLMPEMVLPQSPLVIVGHHGCGKDTVARIICSLTNATYRGSLSFLIGPFLYELFRKFGIISQDIGFHRFYVIRHDYSGYIQHTLNTLREQHPKAVLAAARDVDIITGVRTLEEVELLAEVNASFVWVSREVEEDPTLEYTASDILDFVDKIDVIQNNGDLWDLVRNISESVIVRRFADVEVLA